ncbi:RNA polymerase I enhancer binding protein [Aspergillus brasiliensis]|nr:RNA polymerase I enhancer binding protein [Aspergillus brasiliensis]
MGNSPSQHHSPGRDGASEDLENNGTELKLPSIPLTPTKGAKQEPRSNGSTPRRKRRALDNAEDHNKSPAAPESSQSSPRNISTDRPTKRKKVRASKKSQIQSRKADMVKLSTSPSPATEGLNGSSHGPKEGSITSYPENKDGEGGSAGEESEVKQSIEGSNGQANFKKGKRSLDASGKENKSVGFFTPEEVKGLESFKLDFCTTHGMSSDTFDLMVQHSERDKSNPFPCPMDITTKAAFWKQVYEIIPGRNKRSVYRFMRRHFQCTTQKPHIWTPEQDEELILLHKRHGPKWAHIAKMIGRSDDDVVQRWKNRLEHRQTMNRGPWSESEVRALLEHLQASWHHMKKLGHDVGRDIYEMDETLISWGNVSNSMKNCRSRQQCADKWRKVRRKILTRRSMGNPDAFYDPVVEAKPPKRRSKSRSIASSQSQSSKHFKSAEYVDSDDESGEETGNTSSMDQSTSKIDEHSSSESSKSAPKKSSGDSKETSDRSNLDTSSSGSEESSSESEPEESGSETDTSQPSGRKQHPGHKDTGSLKRQRR